MDSSHTRLGLERHRPRMHLTSDSSPHGLKAVEGEESCLVPLAMGRKGAVQVHRIESGKAEVQ